MRPRTRRLGAAIAVLALVAAGCGGDDSAEDNPPDTPAPPATQAPTPDPTQAPSPDPTPAPTAAPTPSSTDAPAPPPDTSPPVTADPSGEPTVLEIGAEDSEGFSRDRLTIRAGETVTLVFKNKDSGSGEPHNIHIVTEQCVPVGVAGCFTPITEGPDTQELTFSIATPGEYQYICDTHASQMKGVLTVEP